MLLKFSNTLKSSPLTTIGTSMYYYKGCNCMMCNLLLLGKSHFSWKQVFANKFLSFIFQLFYINTIFVLKNKVCTHQVKCIVWCLFHPAIVHWCASYCTPSAVSINFSNMLFKKIDGDKSVFENFISEKN